MHLKPLQRLKTVVEPVLCHFKLRGIVCQEYWTNMQRF